MNHSDNQTHRIRLPGIGMRIIKSVIAVAICFLVNALRGELGMVFYSQLAALWCIQMYRSNTTKNAIQRIIGTCVGAVYGLIYLLLFPHLISVIKSVFWVETIMVSLSLLFVLYTTVVLKKNQASYFSCVVFLSIAINHAHDIVPYLFVWNRFLDTMIGIVIGILVNDIRICINPDKETLFVSGLDDTILNINESLSPFSKVELNRMIDSGLKFTISTIRTPASLIDPVKDIRLKLPVIAMNGAVLYDTQKNSFIKITSIPIDLSNQLMDIILDSGLCWYANVIVDDVLLIYYTRNDDDINTKLVNDLKVSPYRNYIERPLPKNEDVVYFMLLDKSDRINEFYLSLMDREIASKINVITYQSGDFPGYSYIKIYDKTASKDNMLGYLKETYSFDKTITFGTIKGQYDVLINKNDANDVVRRIRKLYEPLFIRKVSS
ncbi:MAG: HAD hydrolase family protein [Saccharofermentans sp.]|nr:HAD hydrolase family protein [Saccharofermentans sp.]